MEYVKSSNLEVIYPILILGIKVLKTYIFKGTLTYDTIKKKN